MDIKQIKITPDFIIDLIVRRRWYFLLPLCITLSIGICLSIIIPRVYEAQTLILVEGQRVPENFVQSIVTEDSRSRINTISQLIMSRSNLESIVNQYDLFSDEDGTEMYMEDKVELLRSKITVDLIRQRRSQTDAFIIAFRGKHPEKVSDVTNGLAKSFIEQNMIARESQATGTKQFLESELEAMRRNLEQVEESIKEYRKTNMGELPEQLETNLRILERLQDNLSDRKQNWRDAKIRYADLQNQVSERQPSIVVIGGDQRTQDGVLSLDDLILELESLRGRYTDEHPDIIRLKKQIKEYEADDSGGQDDSYRSRLSARIPAVVRTQLSELRSEIKIAESEIKELESQIITYEKRIENTPRREQELLSLRRDYENIQASYDSLQRRKMEADIAVNMERQKKGEQFRIVDPAIVPQRPVEPNLVKIFLFVIAAGLGVGGGAAVLLEYLNPSFQKAEEIESTFDIPVLAAIPSILSSRQILLKKINKFGSITVAVVVAGLFTAMGLITMKGL